MKTLSTASTLVAITCLGLLSPGRIVGQVITNGGFESGDFSPGWTRLSDAEGGVNTFVTSASGGIAPFAGTSFATFSNHSPNVSGITQTFSTTIGQTYDLSYWYTNSVGADISNEFKVTWNGNVLTDLVGYTSLGAVWTNATFFVTGTGSDTLAFSGFQNSGYNGLDNVSLVASTVPEFSTCAAVLGLTALGFAVWRKRGSRLLAPVTVNVFK